LSCGHFILCEAPIDRDVDKSTKEGSHTTIAVLPSSQAELAESMMAKGVRDRGGGSGGSGGSGRGNSLSSSTAHQQPRVMLVPAKVLVETGPSSSSSAAAPVSSSPSSPGGGGGGGGSVTRACLVLYSEMDREFDLMRHLKTVPHEVRRRSRS
jgi:hypothetical protein